MTYQELAQQSLDIQDDACNLSGVAYSRTGWRKAGQMRKIDTVVGLRRYEAEIGDSRYPVKTLMYVNAVDNREARKRIHEALCKDSWKREDYRILSVRLASTPTHSYERQMRAANRIYLAGSQ